MTTSIAILCHESYYCINLDLFSLFTQKRMYFHHFAALQRHFETEVLPYEFPREDLLSWALSISYKLFIVFDFLMSNYSYSRQLPTSC